ncbi:MAG: Phage tail fiber protein [uncultured Truepera sp.]|uniref:Phage tail fiber protein n=1 Tax=uncultured Truepera sp. TaxID=543023 RepID=A0A6J4VPG4_9DEIN|nr:MAG: Phage tail fiber protein [uncultured Truepera sp.]
MPSPDYNPQFDPWYDRPPENTGGASGGAAVAILGSFADPAQLPATGASGDGYLISPNLWVWSEGSGAYLNAGPIQGPAGPAGSRGPVGAAGLPGAAGADGQPGPPGTDGLRGPQGLPGAPSVKGDDGAGLSIKGSFANSGQLPANGAPGDSYLITDDLWVWSSTNSAFENVGRIQGPIGETGAQGVQGETGNQGPQGVQGLTGATGAAGTPGAAGAKGDTGDAGPQGVQG